MREQKSSIYEMTDRELRTYKRALRRQRKRRRTLEVLLMALCLTAVCVISYRSLISRANSGTEELCLKYYTGITVETGDSLWNIADKYIDYERYPNKEAYIREVCSINSLDDASKLHAGQRLIVPYYSMDFVK